MWGDGLKSYKGSTTFTYDAIGNPLSYNNGSAYTFTWQNGRELATATVNGITSSYTYNSDGLRTRKVVGSKTYDYYWFGSQLAMMTITSGSSVMTLKFYYDANGLPIIFDYNGTQYHYITNLQGDVVGLANEYGIVATYAYDAWGKIISTSGITSMEESALAANPIRYRGYIYDAETEFYYLQSRYYDPVMCRFINADGYVSTGTGLLGYNMYAYCDNNPVNNSDPSGNILITLVPYIVDLCREKSIIKGAFKDLKNIDFNIFNSDEKAVINAEYVSFYKGQLVIKHNLPTDGRSCSFIIMFLHKDDDNINTVKHERGHLTQMKLLPSIPSYLLTIAFPSILSDGHPYYYSLPWERTADFFCRVERENYLYKDRSLAWGFATMVLGPPANWAYFLIEECILNE